MEKLYNNKKLLNFLQEIDHDFSPSLSSKVDLEEYVEKIMDQAKIIRRYSPKGEIIALTVLYCNDTKEFRAYVSLVAVAKEHRSRGHAKSMMEEAIDYVRGNRFHFLGIHSNNRQAISLYEKLGFSIISGSERVYMELNLD